MNMPPSTFTEYPFNSVLQKGEAEQVAANIMVIRKRLGDTWSPLNWKTYKAEREKDEGEGCTEGQEKNYFDDVVKLIPDALGAISFSPIWARAARAWQTKQQKSVLR